MSIPTWGCDLEVKVTDLDFSYKSQNVWIQVYIAISSGPLDEFHLYLALWQIHHNLFITLLLGSKA